LEEDGFANWLRIIPAMSCYRHQAASAAASAAAAAEADAEAG